MLTISFTPKAARQREKRVGLTLARLSDIVGIAAHRCPDCTAKLSGRLYCLHEGKSIDEKQKINYACLMKNSALPHEPGYRLPPRPHRAGKKAHEILYAENPA